MASAALHLNRPPRHGITTLGHGRRAAIWTQGCGLGCAGCVSRDTWATGGTPWEPDELAAVVTDPAERLDGLTISGGEPFDQPEALEALVHAVRDRTDPTCFDILCFSGHRREHLERDHRSVVELLDVLVDGRFRADRPTSLPWRGSDNQRLHRLSPLAEDRYGDADVPRARPPLQIVFHEDGVEMVGIPATGQMQQIEAQLALRGIRLEGTSWRS